MLHFWMPETGVPDAHTHRWDFESLVVGGKIEVEVLQECTEPRAGELLHQYWHQIAEEDFGATAQWADGEPARLDQVRRNMMAEGETHIGRWNEIHRVRCLSDQAITFFRHGPPAEERTMVYTPVPRQIALINGQPVPRIDEVTVRELLDLSRGYLHSL